MNGQFESNYTGEGIHVEWVKNAIIQDNVVECAPPNPLKDTRCGTVTYFDNRPPAGPFIEMPNDKYGQLESDVEDIFPLTLT